MAQCRPARVRVLSGIFEPFGGFADESAIEEGYVGLPEAPGIGLERKASLAPVLAAVRG